MNIDTKDTKRLYHFKFSIDNNFSLDEDSHGKIKDSLLVQGQLEKLVENKLLLTFNITGTMIYACSRCLEDVEEEIDYFFEDEIETNNDGVIVLDEYINDCLFINEPYKILCKEDCKGLCPICGTNLNKEQCNCSQEEELDPRLAVLKQLL